MKRATFSLLALAMAATSCSRPDGDNVAAEASSTPPQVQAAVVAVSALGKGGCAMRWNGRPATREQVVQHAVDVMTAAIEAAGGPEHMTKFPSATIEAAPALPYHCVALAVGDLQRAGVADVELRPAGSADAGSARANLLMNDEPIRPEAMIELGARGRINWNREEIDLARLRQYAEIHGTLLRGPDDALVMPAGDTSFGEVVAVVRALNENEAEPTLIGCAGDTEAAPASGRSAGDPGAAPDLPLLGAPLPRC